MLVRLRWATLLLGAVAAAGLAEQHHHPAPVIRALSGSTWPSDSWSVWTLWFTAASLLCLGAVVAPLSQRVRAQRAAAVLLSSALWSRGLALFLEYRWDLWGTVVQIWLELGRFNDPLG